MCVCICMTISYVYCISILYVILVCTLVYDIVVPGGSATANPPNIIFSVILSIILTHLNVISATSSFRPHFDIIFKKAPGGSATANPPTNIVGFRGLDSSTILIQRGGIIRPIGDFSESLSQVMLVGTMSLGGLGVCVYVYVYMSICVSIHMYL